MMNVLDTTKKKTLLVVVLTAVVLIGVAVNQKDVLNGSKNNNQNITQKEGHIVKVGTARVLIDIADTPTLRARGLSGRKLLLDDQGMYFIFDHPGMYPFWMKEMNFPIDIIWIGEHMSVVDITKSASPSSFPQTFVSSAPALYVLEVQAGFAERHGVKIGDQVVLLDSN